MVHYQNTLNDVSAEFTGIPATVKLEDSTAPGTIVTNFTVECVNSSDTLSVTLEPNVSPAASFFNPLNILSPGSYQVSLSPSAALDAKQVNQYTLTYTAHCGTEVAMSELFIHVIPADRLECSRRLGDIGLVPLKVPENFSPGGFIYHTVLREPRTGSLNYTIENNDLSLTINSVGAVQAPATGFSREHAGKTFSMKIVVKDSGGRSCRIPLSVEVLPVYHNQVNFTASSVAVSVLENTGPLKEIIKVQATGKNVLYQIISGDTTYFTIDSEMGVIKNTYNLNLKRNPGLAQTLLLVRAYDMSHPMISANIMVNITVKPHNLQGPLCSPAIYVATIPETTPNGTTLPPLGLSCVGAANGNRSLHYKIVNQSPPYSFRMEGADLKVNSTLDCDSVTMASLKFQYRATILVMDDGSPPRTTSVPVLVTVTPVNEYPPECSPQIFSIAENVGFGSFVGRVNATDRDYPFNYTEYSIPDAGALSPFYIGRRSGELYVSGPLDHERMPSYRLIVHLKDLDNDAPPSVPRTGQCVITINVQNVNDNPPECKPPFELHHIYSTRARTMSITALKCTDKDELSELIYTIVGGNTNGRFRMERNNLFHNTFSYNHDGIFDPLTFELLVEVTDSRSAPRLSTTATIIVYVTPWTTTVPTTTITTTTVPKKPIILYGTERYWAPDPWFVVVLMLTGVLLLSALGLLIWRLCWRKAPGEMSQSLLQNKGDGLERNYIAIEEPSKEKGKGSAEVLSLQHDFDGRAQDPVTGQYYLFDSSTGARRWV
ncbi:cadherin-related family member 4 [Elgaria multicarinata webbii]|uniref:cadherin-related family member 4 n=1 Tax=Elgaria multicarinata webbii TaxID=159646 RepID=UPI002FCCC62E